MNILKRNTKNNKTIFVVLLFLFSILFNQYYGHIGIQPIDSFFSFNSGYDILNGHFPFKDYWTITGPLIDLFQAIFFKIFGVSWFSYVFHASIFNSIFSIATFFTFYKLKLNINYCFLYAILVSILAYPSAGTPYVDHQSSYLSTIGIFCFILALKTEKNFYWLFLPIIFALAFFTKQTPASYVFLVISFLSLIHFFYNFNIKKIIFILIGSFISFLIFFLLLGFAEIPFKLFYEQYILFPLSLGESRLEFIFPLEFQRIIFRFKLLHLSSLLMIIVAIKNFKKNYNYLVSNEFLITLSLLGLLFSLIIHQLMTINGMFIYFLIPILVGFSHIYFDKNFKKQKFILYALIILSVFSTVYYSYKYINKRHFMDLHAANIKKSVDAEYLDKKLKGLKWITPQYINEPKKEMENLKEAIDFIKMDKSKKIIVTDYQFISVVLSSYDYSPSKYWYAFHVNPAENQKYFKNYRSFFIEKIKKNKINKIYIIKPLIGFTDNNVLNGILSNNCFIQKNLTSILTRYTLTSCEDLRE